MVWLHHVSATCWLLFFRWGLNVTHIWFEVQVKTLGYVGFGISRDGRMVPADVVIGWVAGNQVHFQVTRGWGDRGHMFDKGLGNKLLNEVGLIFCVQPSGEDGLN